MSAGEVQCGWRNGEFCLTAVRVTLSVQLAASTPKMTKNANSLTETTTWSY